MITCRIFILPLRSTSPNPLADHTMHLPICGRPSGWTTGIKTFQQGNVKRVSGALSRPRLA